MPDLASENSACEIVLRPIVKPAPGAGESKSSVAEYVEAGSNAWSDFVAPREFKCELFQTASEGRNALVFDAQSRAHREPIVNAPLILDVKSLGSAAGRTQCAEVVHFV